MSVRAKDDTMSVASSYTVGEDLFGEVQGDEEKIFVSVRVRPLNDKEIARNDVSDWECINNTTIIFKTNMPERSMFPTAYTFDRVFGSECPTEQVYEEGTKEVALSAVSGINSTIFAYGQTSSGKTYTMTGITEYAVADIYEYIDKHKEREFVLKFSAMEIYNEAVRDLLSTDGTPLRVLDDPERGTIVEKLTEETLEDWNHLQELLSICEAQRQIGETSLNENSSRSHQILRLTVESSAREYSGAGSSSTLIATVNFVDLAGSERASQAFTAGLRLKEGSHINRSLLTLGTVIRKLSKGGNGHVPYRDSKLTRILQNSLGGNARTAIICTMSPARGHLEQSRNTLLFASCAKEVSTNAQVNVVMSDKVLVKQLQKELARMESQLRSRGSISIAGDSTSRLREQDLLIEQMDKEIKELIWQRDLAQSRVESLLKSVGEDRLSRVDEISASETSEVITPLRLSRVDEIPGLMGSSTFKDFDDSKLSLKSYGSPENNFLTDKGKSKFSGAGSSHGWEEIARRENNEYEDAYKDVRCIEMEENSIKGRLESDPLSPNSKQKEENLDITGAMKEGAVLSLRNEDKMLSRINSANTYDALKQKIQELHRTIDYLQRSPSLRKKVASSTKSLRWTRTTSRRSILMTIPSWLWPDEEESTENENPLTENNIAEEELEEEEEEERIEQTPPGTGHDYKIHNMTRDDTQQSVDSHSTEESIKEIDVHVDDTTSVVGFGSRMNQVTKNHSENLNADVPVPESSSRTSELRKTSRGPERGNSTRQHHTNWPIKFERYRRKIFELWSRCNVPLVHRSYFFLLFKGDPSDNVYMEVELRRLYFLKDTSSRGTNALIDNQIVSTAASIKALNRERESLAKQLQKKYTKKERENLYEKWGIDLDTKQRSLQLARRLWTDHRDMKHIKESANLVAKLFGFVEPRYAPKEMFGLSFITPSMAQRPTSWRDNMSSLL